MGDMIGGVVGLVAGERQASAARDAARAQAREAERGRQHIDQMYGRYETNAQPYMAAGTGALSGMQRFLGGDMSGFNNSAQYLFARDQMQQGTERSAAARGGLMGGRFQADLSERMNGLAGQHANTYFNQLAGLAGMGANMTSNLGGAGLNAAGMMAQQGNLAGQARASGYTNAANAQTQGWGALAGGLNSWGQGSGWWGGGSSYNTKDPWSKG